MSSTVPAAAVTVAVAATLAACSIAACTGVTRRQSAPAHNRSVACAVWRDSIPQGGPLVYLDNEVDRPITLLRRKLPKAAPAADGEAVVRFVVAPDGRVDWESYEVLDSSNPSLERYAEELVAGSVFTPAMLEGEAVRQCMVLPVAFSVER